LGGPDRSCPQEVTVVARQQTRPRPTPSRRILVASLGVVWPPTSGAAIRRAVLVRALSAIAPTDLLLFGDPANHAIEATAGAPDPATLSEVLGVDRVAAVPVVPVPPSRGPLARFDSYAYVEATNIDAARTGEGIRACGLPLDDYTQIWCLREAAFAAVADILPRVPRVLDVDEADHVRLLQEARSAASELARSGVRRSLGRTVRSTVTAARWYRMKRRRALAAAACLVSSAAEAARLRITADVVPNCTLDSGHAAGSGAGPRTVVPVAERGPVVSFVGRLNYQPNIDGVVWFATEVLPHLRELVPDVRIRIAGRGDARIAVAVQPGVEVLGEVDDPAAELDLARLSIAPLRSGSGTRLKIIEALAHGVPVVTTSIGCEGLDLVVGRDVLVADTGEAFARRCADVLTDDALATALGEQGRARHEERFGEQVAHAAVAAVVDRVELHG
jgi:glycosyltransferase involved in cell wall biosynthesis